MRCRHARVTLASLLCLAWAWADPESNALRSGSDAEAVQPKLEEGRRDRRLAKVLHGGLRFPASFEHDGIGSCPAGWTCSNNKTKVCGRDYQQQECVFPGLTAVDGDRFLAVGDDFGTSEAKSSVFTLPERISRIRLRMGGGADGPSGFYLYSDAGKLLCFVLSNADRNSLSMKSCTDLAGHGGEAVYMQVADKERGNWGKVLIDDIRLQDTAGRDLSIDGSAISGSEGGSHEVADSPTTTVVLTTTAGPATTMPPTTTASTTTTTLPATSSQPADVAVAATTTAALPTATAPPTSTATSGTAAPLATTATTTTTTAQAEKTVSFDAEYDEVVGSHAAKFTEECSAAMRPVRCCNVRKGSILVDLKGESAAVDASVAMVLEDGLDLPSFPKLTAIPEDAWHGAGKQDAVHGLTLVLGLLALAGCAVVGFISSWKKRQQAEVLDEEEPEWQSHETNAPASGDKVAAFIDVDGQESRLWVDGHKLHWAVMDMRRTYRLRTLDIEEAGEPGQFCVTCYPLQALITSPPPGDEQRQLMIRLAAWAQQAGIRVTGSGALAFGFG